MKRITTMFIITFVLLSLSVYGQSLSEKSGTEGHVAIQTESLLHDNTAINVGTSGIVSGKWKALAAGSQLTNCADDFTVPAGEVWTIDSVYFNGFTSTGGVPDPERFGIIIYEDNAGQPGTEVYNEEMGITSGTFPDSNYVPTTGLVLSEGTYWLSAVGVYDTATGLATGRWNWYYGDGTIGSNAYLQDLTAFFGGLPWTSLPSLVAGANSLSFAIYGSSGSGVPTMTVAQAIEDLNNDGVPDRLDDTVKVYGVCISPNYQTSNQSWIVWGGTRGVTTFNFGTGNPDLQLGDSVEVTGVIGQYNGLTQLQPEDGGIVVISAGTGTLPEPTVLTIGQYLADPEAYEGTLVGFMCLSLADGTWPSSGSSATLQVTDGIDTVDYRIDSDTDVDDNTEPNWPVDLLGIGSQFASGGGVDFGYQIMPRYYATDVLPCGTIPVELSVFTADVNGSTVSLKWSTATETNNAGFEVQRSLDGENFTQIGFVDGAGTTTDLTTYTYDDQISAKGTYFYRLRQIDFDGTATLSDVLTLEVENVVPIEFSLRQNYPNPFNPATVIEFTVPVNEVAVLKVYNTIGEEIATLFKGVAEAGNLYQVSFDASDLNSGVYFYTLTQGSNVQTQKMMLLK